MWPQGKSAVQTYNKLLEVFFCVYFLLRLNFWLIKLEQGNGQKGIKYRTNFFSISWSGSNLGQVWPFEIRYFLLSVSLRDQKPALLKEGFDNPRVLAGRRALRAFQQGVGEFSGRGFEHFLRSDLAFSEVRDEEFHDLKKCKFTSFTDWGILTIKYLDLTGWLTKLKNPALDWIDSLECKAMRANRSQTGELW